MGHFDRDRHIRKRKETGFSLLCEDLRTRWNRHSGTCVPCPVAPGNEVTPNCGYSDDGGRHQVPYTECKQDTFNPGNWYYCLNCTTCPPGSVVIQPCNPTTDTQCEDRSDQTTRVSVTETTTTSSAKVSSPTENGKRSIPESPHEHSVGSASLLWAAPLIILIVILLALSAYIIYMKRKRGPGTAIGYRRRSSSISDEIPQFPTAVCNCDLKDNLSPEILSAPLQTVMNDLDVLEQLMILLDPESPGVRNTKHLASHCSFSSAWITYTYSMKESKSPLKAVLEGVTSRHPDWTVGHLANLLKQMERNDALTVLAQLKLNEMAV